MSASTTSYATHLVGTPSTPEHRVFVSYNRHAISALHDVPLFAKQTDDLTDMIAASELELNMIVTGPRWTTAKMVVTPAEALAPIRQAMQGRRLAHVRSCFPHRGYIWNYGSLPQTWSEGAPLYVCEIGENIFKTGDVRSVRVLGILAPRDEGVLCWTLLVIDTADPLAECLHDVTDIERECPGLITATKEWFRLYKLPDGKGENSIELDGEVKGKDYARDILRTAHEAWRNLVTGGVRVPSVNLSNLTIRNSPGHSRNNFADLEGRFTASQAGSEPSVPEPLSASKWWHIGTQL